MASQQVDDVTLLALVCEQLGVSAKTALGGRASENWLVHRGARPLVLRAHRRMEWQTDEQLPQALQWRAEVRSAVHALGWPAARPLEQPILHDGTWWTLEDYLPGSVVTIPPVQHAELLAAFQALNIKATSLGAQPGRLDHLAILQDDAAEASIADCEDREDRAWLMRRLEQARTLAVGIEWTASPRVLVHGDFVAQNLLFEGQRLSGVLDFELATVDRRVVDLIHVWRCRYDAVVRAYDAVVPLGPDEWRMLLVDWWALLVSLSVVSLRAGHQPQQWELDGLRRTSQLAEQLHSD